jgi:hypothetical protein
MPVKKTQFFGRFLERRQEELLRRGEKLNKASRQLITDARRWMESSAKLIGAVRERQRKRGL